MITQTDIPDVIRFKPYFKNVLWGGDRIAGFKNLPPQGDRVGESWELSPMAGHESVIDGGPFDGRTLNDMVGVYGPAILGERVTARFGNSFPLLVKFIDSADDLSIQVHPDDFLAARRHSSLGKTEMWLILKPASHGYLYAGFSKKLDAESYRRAIAENTIVSCLNRIDTVPGDVFMLPPGRVHSIGRGNFLVEIQQASDITYRIYDFDRRGEDGQPRELHIEESVDAVDFNDLDVHARKADYDATTPFVLATCQYFTAKLVNLTAPVSLELATGQSFTVIIAVEGDSVLTDAAGNPHPLAQGTTVLIPARVSEMHAAPAGPLSRLVTVEV